MCSNCGHVDGIRVESSPTTVRSTCEDSDWPTVGLDLREISIRLNLPDYVTKCWAKCLNNPGNKIVCVETGAAHLWQICQKYGIPVVFALVCYYCELANPRVVLKKLSTLNCASCSTITPKYHVISAELTHSLTVLYCHNIDVLHDSEPLYRALQKVIEIPEFTALTPAVRSAGLIYTYINFKTPGKMTLQKISCLLEVSLSSISKFKRLLTVHKLTPSSLFAK